MRLEFIELPAEDHSPEMLVIPGWGVSPQLLLPWLKTLQTLFKIRLLVLPGMGAEAEEIHLPSFIRLLSEQVADNSVVVGWSLGGNLAIELARAAPEKVSATITLATNLKFCEQHDWHTAMPQQTFDQFYQSAEQDLSTSMSLFHKLCSDGDPLRKQQLKRLKKSQQELDDRLALFWLKQLGEFDQREKLPAPLLMLFAEHDALVNSSVVESVSAMCPVNAYKYKSPQNQIETFKVALIKNSGHMLFDSSPDECAGRVIQFLQEQGILDHRDKKAVALSFSRAAKSYDDAAHLQQQVADYLLQKAGQFFCKEQHREQALIDDDSLLDNTILDLGCGNGRVSFGLQALHPRSSVIALDLAEGMLRQAKQRVDLPLLAGDAEQLPLASSSIDKLFSSLTIQWCENIEMLFSELYRVMADNSVATISTLGPETLQQLREAWMSIDLFEHVNRFYPLSMLQEAAEKAGFIFSAEEEQLDYYFENLSSLMRSLKEIGAQHQSQYKRQGLTGKNDFIKLSECYEQYRTEQGLPASYQVFYLTLYKK